ncbi:hypothetical protein IP70_16735 [alpha proteobacterium AAP38]|nr:hypothetical protein IP70_16735 [alpha proteobacterium AAP38]
MLSVSTLSSSAQAASYYKGAKAGDYYSKGQGGAVDTESGGPDCGPSSAGIGVSGGGGPVTGAELRASTWYGAGAAAAGLSGPVDQDMFRAVLEGRVPGGPQLGRTVKGPDGAMERLHVPGIDLTFSAPKSVSVLALVKGDRAVLEAHDEAVASALAYLEKNVLETRKSVDGVMEVTTGQDMVAALFREEASRNLEPQLHTHAVVANMVRDADGSWRSLHNPSIYSNKMLVGQIYRSHLAKSLTALGYGVERTSDDGLFEVAGVPKELCETFSTRRQEIKAQLKAWGRADATAAANAAVATRRAKQSVGLDRLMEAWQIITKKLGYEQDQLGRTQDRGAETVATVTPIPTIDTKAPTLLSKVTAAMTALVARWRAALGASAELSTSDPLALAAGIRRDTAMDAVLYGLADLSERSSVFSLSNLKAAVLSSGLGKFSLHDIDQAVATLTEKNVILPAVHPEMAKAGMVTTGAALETEQETLRLIDDGRGAVSPLASSEGSSSILDNAGISGEARTAALVITGSRDRFVGLQGWAGTGKTTLFQAVQAVADGHGKQVLALAPQTSMVRRLEEDGFDARTVASFLTKFGGVVRGRYTEAGLREMRARMKDVVLLVDEAGRLSTAQMRDLNRVATALQIPRVVYAGDIRQLGAIEAGAPFEQAQDAGMTTATLTEIRRQQTPETRDAVYASIDGNVARAFRLLGEGRIVEAKADVTGLNGAAVGAAVRNAVANATVASWADLPPEERATSVVIAPSNTTRSAVTSGMRDVLKQEGQLHGAERTIGVLANTNTTKVRTRVAGNYAAGQVVRFTRPIRSLGIAAGDHLEVLRVDAPTNQVHLQTKDGNTVSWDPDGREVRRGEAVQIFERRELALMAGDKIRWTVRDAGRKIDGGATGNVEQIDDRMATVRLQDGRLVSLDHSAGELRHIDHDHVQTTFRAQGLTAGRAIIAINSRERFLNSIRSFYVNLSRARMDVRLVVDDRHAAIRSILANTGDKATASASQQRQEAPEVPRSSLPPALEYAIAHLAEREAVFSRGDVLKAAMQAGFGSHNVDEIEQAVVVAEKEGTLIPAGNPHGSDKGRSNERYFTTPEALVAEKAAVDHIRRGKGAIAPLLDQAERTDLIAQHPLNAEQSEVANFLLATRDRFVAVQGLAGVGKTTMTRAVVDGIRLAGSQVLGLAPSTAAVKELSDGAGIDAATLQSFLQEFGYVARGEASPAQLEGLRDEFGRTVIIVDEGSMESNRQMADLVRIVEVVGARSITLGDVKQLRSVEAGRPFDIMQRSGMATVYMTDIQRQTEEDLRSGVYAASEGKVALALAKVGADNIIQVGTEEDPASRLSIASRIAADWLDLPQADRAVGKVMIVAPARFTRDAINHEIHEGLTAKGEIGAQQATVMALRNKSFTRAQSTLASNYKAGDVVRFVSGLGGAAIRKDEYLTVVRVDQAAGTVSLRHGDRVIDWKPGDANHCAKVAVYEVVQRQIGAGERIRWTNNDKVAGTVNGRRADVVEVDGRTVRIRFDDGRIGQFDVNDAALRHMDYDYARTVYASQGATTTAVWGALAAADNKLANQQSFYVVMSRARIQAKLYVDDLKGLTKLLEAQTGVASSALMGVGHPLARENDILDRWIGGMAGPQAGLGRTPPMQGPQAGPTAAPVPHGAVATSTSTPQHYHDVELSL